MCLRHRGKKIRNREMRREGIKSIGITYTRLVSSEINDNIRYDNIWTFFRGCRLESDEEGVNNSLITEIIKEERVVS